MKKRLISLVAAAALVGGISVASAPAAKAGNVTVKGDTQVQLYGFIKATFAWDKQMTGDPDHSNMPNYKGKTQLSKDTYDKINYDGYSGITRLGLKFKNADANLVGGIEAGFHESGDTLRLRRAYIQHNLDNFYVLIGKEWILEDMFTSITAGFDSPAGFNEAIARVPEVKVGTNLDLGSANLDLALAFESGSKSAVTDGDFDGGDGKYALEVTRVIMPYPAARAVLNFETGFGAPATAYVWGSLIPVKVSDKNDGAYKSDDSETSYAVGVGLKVPVSMVTVGLNYQYSKGATGYAGVDDYTPASYYYVNGDVEETKMNAFEANVVVSPMPCVSVGAEYDFVEFKNDEAFDDNKPKVHTYLANVKIKTTKYTTLTLEWRHVKAKKFNALPGVGTDDDDFSGDQFYATYVYTF